MERFRDLEEDLSDLGDYSHSTGFTFEEQKKILSDKELLKDYLYKEWFSDIMDNMISISRYCNDEELCERLQWCELEDGDEDRMMDDYVDWLVDDFSYWWTGHDEISEVQPTDRIRLYRAVGATDFSDISLEQSNLGNCWTYDRETADTIDACLVGEKRFIFIADVKAECIDFVLSAIYQSWDDEGGMVENEVRVVDTDGIDLLKVVDVDGKVYWEKE